MHGNDVEETEEVEEWKNQWKVRPRDRAADVQ
jgi:hypothetical protein